MKNKGYTKFGGQISYIMGDVQVANNFFSTKGPKLRRGLLPNFEFTGP